MGTRIDNSVATSQSYSRQIVRDSTGNLYVTDRAPSDDLEIRESTDGGSSWSLVNDNIDAASSGVNHDSAVDSTDVIHMSSRNAANTSQAFYNAHDISSGSFNTSDEVIFDNKDGVKDTAIVVDSADTVYAVVQFVAKVMGTSYDHLKLLERTGSGSWTDHGTFASGEVNHQFPTAAVDGNDDIHIAWSGGSNWTKYDVSAGSFVTNESVGSNTGAYSLIINSSNEPIVGYQRYDGTNLTDTGIEIAERSGGSWTTDMVAGDTSSVSWTGPTVTFGGSDIYVVYGRAEDIEENHASGVGSFSTADAVTVESSSNALEDPSCRWQFNNENDPSPDVIDFVYYDSTNSDLYYSSVSTSKSQTLSEATAVGTP